MKSSDNRSQDTHAETTINELLDDLHLRLGVSQELIAQYFDRDEKFYIKLSSEYDEGGKVRPPERLEQEDRQRALNELIYAFRPLKKIITKLDPDIPLWPLERLIDDLWSISEGRRTRLLIKPKGNGGGNRASLHTSLHRAPLIVAYDRMIAEGWSKNDSLIHIASQTDLKATTIDMAVKDFHEGAKDAETLEVYRVLSQRNDSFEALIKVYNEQHRPQRG